MQTFRDGDIFAAGADLIVNAVNCKRVMGKGLAKAIADRYPYVLAPYKQLCAVGKMSPGDVQIVAPPHQISAPWLANLATKDDWRNPSQLSWVKEGVRKLSQQARSGSAQYKT